MWSCVYLCSGVKTPTITLSGDSFACHNQNKETKAIIGHGILYEPHKGLPAYGRPVMNLQSLQETSRRASGCDSQRREVMLGNVWNTGHMMVSQHPLACDAQGLHRIVLAQLIVT